MITVHARMALKIRTAHRILLLEDTATMLGDTPKSTFCAVGGLRHNHQFSRCDTRLFYISHGVYNASSHKHRKYVLLTNGARYMCFTFNDGRTYDSVRWPTAVLLTKARKD